MKYYNFKRSIWLCLIIGLALTTSVQSYLGINWGRMSYQRMIPSMVVDMILQNGIHNVKLFSSSDNVLRAFAETGVGVTVTIPNDDLKNITNVDDAKGWLQSKVYKYVDVDFRYINVGTEPLSPATVNGKTYFHAVDVLEYFQKALKEPQHANKSIKAIMSHSTDVLIDVNKPSEGDFRPEVKDEIVRSCQLLYQDNAPVWLDIFPIYSARKLFNDIEFAFFDNKSPSNFVDGGNNYNNIFEVIFDTFVTALNKAGLHNMTIIVGQIGWPTDGIEGANMKNAERFYKGFLKRVLNGKGTPLYPGTIHSFIHNLADESKLKIAYGAHIRHWGIYKADGNPKYNIDFSGQGRDIKPASGKGITHMPKRWCVFNNITENMDRIKKEYDYACNKSDCTSMSEGGSCSHLRFPLNISYAFNMYFQSRSQRVSDETCTFDGLGVITPNDPSSGNCSFPVGILAAEQYGGYGLAKNDKIIISNGVIRGMEYSRSTMCFLFLLVFLVLV